MSKLDIVSLIGSWATSIAFSVTIWKLGSAQRENRRLKAELDYLRRAAATQAMLHRLAGIMASTNDPLEIKRQIAPEFVMGDVRREEEEWPTTIEVKDA